MFWLENSCVVFVAYVQRVIRKILTLSRWLGLEYKKWGWPKNLRFEVDFEDRCFSTYSNLFQWILWRKYFFQIYKTISVSLALQFLRTGMIWWDMETKGGQDEWELVRKLWESAERGNKGSDWTGSCDWRDERWAKHKRIKKCDDWRGDEGPGNNSLSPCWRCLGQHWAWFCYQNKGLGQIITSEIISRTCHSW